MTEQEIRLVINTLEQITVCGEKNLSRLACVIQYLTGKLEAMQPSADETKEAETHV